MTKTITVRELKAMLKGLKDDAQVELYASAYTDGTVEATLEAYDDGEFTTLMEM